MKWTRDWASSGGNGQVFTYVTNGSYVVMRQSCIDGMRYVVAEGMEPNLRKDGWPTRLEDAIYEGEDLLSFKTEREARKWADEKTGIRRPPSVRRQDGLPDQWVYLTFFVKCRRRSLRFLNWIVVGDLRDARQIEADAFAQAAQRCLKETGQVVNLEKTVFYSPRRYLVETRRLMKEGRYTEAGPIVNRDAIRLLDT